MICDLPCFTSFDQLMDVCFPIDDGISIPCSYTSFLAPLSSSKLYNEVRGCRERDKDPECHFETPYVVRLHNFHQLADPKPCFTFVHPTPGTRSCKDRQTDAKKTMCTPKIVPFILHFFVVTLSVKPLTLDLYPVQI